MACLASAIRAGHPPVAIAAMLCAAATDHRYLDGGHTLVPIEQWKDAQVVVVGNDFSFSYERLTAAARARLLEIIKDKAVVHGRVTLSSGKEADYYVDLRRITLDGEADRDRDPTRRIELGRLDSLDEPVRQTLGVLRRPRRDHDRELLAAETVDDVRRAHRVLQRLGEGAQDHPVLLAQRLGRRRHDRSPPTA